MGKAIIIGGGAAGMYAAIAAADNGCEVHLYEKNEKLGKKLFITGKGRCNLTNDCDMETLMGSVCRNGKFLYSAFGNCGSRDVMEFFASEGLKLKTERGGRVFPASNHSSDVIRTLERAMQRRGVQVHLNCGVKRVLTQKDVPVSAEAGAAQQSSGQESADADTANMVVGVLLEDGRTEKADYVAVATGGCSYASTGSTGDGYRFAAGTGHGVTKQYPSLVPLETAEAWPKELMGLSLRNVAVKVCREKKVLYEEQGEMLFTHFGVSGPLILSASSRIADLLSEGPVKLYVDLKPALRPEQLDARILRDFEANKNRQFKNALGGLLPAKLIPVMIRLSEIEPEKPVNLVTRQERERLLALLKGLPMTLIRARGFSEAIITRGGVDVKNIRPGTMESKKVQGLYFIGEVLDLDALTGGFNLQIAWATGYAAGRSMY